MHCPKCGAELKFAEAEICPSCGMRIKEEPPKKLPSDSGCMGGCRKFHAGIIAGLGIILLFGALITGPGNNFSGFITIFILGLICLIGGGFAIGRENGWF
jgi:hypothetical protein